MIIAKQKEQENIVEYVLYMRQIQDIVRACDFDIARIDELIIKRYLLSLDDEQRVRQWYLGIIAELRDEHRVNVSALEVVMDKVEALHRRMLGSSDSRYHELYSWARPNIEELRRQAGAKCKAELTDTEVCINSLYTLLQLRMQKKPISDATMQAMATITNLMAYLAYLYKKM